MYVEGFSHDEITCGGFGRDIMPTPPGWDGNYAYLWV